MAPAFKRVAVAAARAADDKKAEAVLLMEVSKISPVTDFLLVATANSRPHLETLEHEIKKAAKEFHIPVLHQAKPASDAWRILDFGGLIVHLMTAEAREFYALERLYGDAPRVRWQAAAPKGNAHARHL